MALDQTLATARQALIAAIQDILDSSPEFLHEWERMTRHTYHAANDETIPAGLGALDLLVQALQNVELCKRTYQAADMDHAVLPD